MAVHQGNRHKLELGDPIAHIHSGGVQAVVPTDVLRTFIAICEFGSFTKAARLFGLTQPAISAQVRKLEGLVGASLISRDAPGISLTARGTEILTLARRLLSINDQILAGARSQTAFVVRFGAPSAFIGSIMKALTSDGSIPGTNVRLRICCDNSENLLHGIRCGYLEIACIVGNDPDIAQAPHVWSEEFVWACAPRAAFQQRDLVPLISSPNRVLPDRIALDALARAKRKYEIVFSANDRAIRYAAAQSGLGYIPVPRRSVLSTLVIEQNLPPLRSMTAAIVTREGLDLAELDPLLAMIKAALSSRKAVADGAMDEAIRL
jgi:DNA-binding transcriptional LysR family regulator